ncbi:CD63 antigen [Holothuria leucospilota]|uniref:Tetraspanin n=1 Tax=Holothuria leucospilota TaxID=206669 RepID=A0A9Q0YL84_HOLLE|nr:CD63 antigen [Holothuria leucospilota]
MGLMKILLFIFNFIFVILGIVLIVSGVLIHTSDKDVDILTDTALPFLSVGTLVIVLGVIVFIVAFTGCCGAIKENKCLLTTGCKDRLIMAVKNNLVLSGTLSLVILLAEILGIVVIVAGILIYTSPDADFEVLMTDKHPFSSVGALTIVLGVIIFIVAFTGCCGAIKENKCLLTAEKCCGFDNATDWKTYGNFTGTTVPSSCCAGGHVNVTCTTSEAFEKGCREALLAKLSSKDYLLLAGTSAIVIVLAEIFGIIFACCVIRDAGKDGKGQYA